MQVSVTLQSPKQALYLHSFFFFHLSCGSTTKVKPFRVVDSFQFYAPSLGKIPESCTRSIDGCYSQITYLCFRGMDSMCNDNLQAKPVYELNSLLDYTTNSRFCF